MANRIRSWVHCWRANNMLVWVDFIWSAICRCHTSPGCGQRPNSDMIAGVTNFQFERISLPQNGRVHAPSVRNKVAVRLSIARLNPVSFTNLDGRQR